jgi:hypothetical protein
MKITKLISHLEELRAKQGDIDVAAPRQITDLSLRKQIPCAACKHRCLISNITLYQTHWYVSPSGCSGGDYWKEGECQFVCHHCDTANRLLFKQKWDDKLLSHVSKSNDVFQLKYHGKFKEVIDTHEDHEEPTATHRWVNNDWIDTLVDK